MAKEDYLNWLYERLLAIKDVMSETATIYIHLDWHIGHYVKVLLDEIFGEENFVNEIIWHYTGNSIPTKSYQKKHDTIFIYSKSEEFILNLDDVLLPYSESTLKRYNHIDEKERKQIDELLTRNNNILETIKSDVLCLIGMRTKIKSTGVLSWLPKDIVKLIAKEVWNTRGNIKWLNAVDLYTKDIHSEI